MGFHHTSHLQLHEHQAYRELYGLERLTKQVAAGDDGVADLGAHVLDDVRRFVNGFAQSDDMCLVCFGREG